MIDATTLTGGLLVEHPTYGLGKIIAVEQATVHVYFLEQSERDKAARFKVPFVSANFVRAESQQHEEFDHLPSFRKVGNEFVIDKKGRTFRDALENFRKFFPGDFKDPKYAEAERNYKLEASQRLIEAFGNGRGLSILKEGRVKDVADLAREFDTTNLVHPRWEKPRIAEALEDVPVASAYFEAVFRLADATEVTPALFEALAKAVGALKSENGPISRWPATTIFLSLLRPDRFTLFWATPMVEAASLVSVALGYRAGPNWQTYAAALVVAKKLLAKLEPLGANDRVGVPC